MKTKACSKCLATKPLSEFWVRNDRGRPYSRCKACIGAKNSLWWKRNPHKTAEYWKLRAEENPERVREIYRLAQRRRRADPSKRLESCIRVAVYASLSGMYKSRKTFEALGYSRRDLMEHLERGFVGGMTWENYGKWHVDHIVPMANFDIVSDSSPDFRKAWALENLQPLWAHDNQVKGRRSMDYLREAFG